MNEAARVLLAGITRTGPDVLDLYEASSVREGQARTACSVGPWSMQLPKLAALYRVSHTLCERVSEEARIARLLNDLIRVRTT